MAPGALLRWARVIITSLPVDTVKKEFKVDNACIDSIIDIIANEPDNFFNFHSGISVIPSEEMLLVCGDLNGHFRKTSHAFEGLHGGPGYGIRNSEGTRLL